MHTVGRRSVHITEAVVGLVHIQRRVQGQRIGLGTVVVLGRDDFNLHPVEGFQGIVQRHDARSLVAVVVGDQNFHGLR